MQRTASGDFASPLALWFARKMRQLDRHLFDSYHPERHYMRGPGPRWHEKHGQAHSTGKLSELGLPGLWNAGA